LTDLGDERRRIAAGRHFTDEMREFPMPAGVPKTCGRLRRLSPRIQQLVKVDAGVPKSLHFGTRAAIVG
jgi:hypothetical protein